MNTLRIYIGSLILILTLFFNIERIDILGENSWNLQSFVYILVTSVVLTILLIPKIHRLRTEWILTGGVIVYLFLKTIIFRGRPIFADVYFFLTMTELFFLLATMFICIRINQFAAAFEKGLQDVILGKERAQLLPYKTSDKIITREMFRSRQHKRPLSLITIKIDKDQIKIRQGALLQEMQEKLVEQYFLTQLTKTLVASLRPQDILMEHLDRSSLYVVCPELGQDHVPFVVNKIEQTLRQYNLSVKIGSASFPEETVTFDGLIEEAEKKIKKSEK